jgi:hypothetical protein
VEQDLLTLLVAQEFTPGLREICVAQSSVFDVVVFTSCGHCTACCLWFTTSFTCLVSSTFLRRDKDEHDKNKFEIFIAVLQHTITIGLKWWTQLIIQMMNATLIPNKVQRSLFLQMSTILTSNIGWDVPFPADEYKPYIEYRLKRLFCCRWVQSLHRI